MLGVDVIKKNKSDWSSVPNKDMGEKSDRVSKMETGPRVSKMEVESPVNKKPVEVPSFPSPEVSDNVSDKTFKDYIAKLPDSSFWSQASKYQIIYSLCGLILGLACVIGGIILFLNGVAGSTGWTAKIIGAETKLSDAAPGTILFVVGLFIIIVSRYSVKVKK